jgi:hypothetical protein
LTVVALSLAGGTATGTSMNPARTFGPAFWNKDFTAHWLYWIAPMSAGFLSSKFYRKIFWCEEKSEGDFQDNEIIVKINDRKYDDNKLIGLTLNIQLGNDESLKNIQVFEKVNNS